MKNEKKYWVRKKDIKRLGLTWKTWRLYDCCAPTFLGVLRLFFWVRYRRFLHLFDIHSFYVKSPNECWICHKNIGENEK